MIRKFLFWGWLVCGLYWEIQAQCNNPIPQINVEQSFCTADGKNVSDLDTNGEDIVWFYQEEGGVQYNDMFVLKTGTYYASNASNGGCSPRLAVTVKVYGAPPETSLISYICKNYDSTVSFLSVEGDPGNPIEWYDSEVGGSLLSGSTILEDGVEYWAQQIDNGCLSARSKTVVKLVDPTPPIINKPIQIFYNDSLSTVSSLEAELDEPYNFIVWYESETSDVPLDPTEPLVNNKVYWAAQYSNGCQSVSRTSVTVIFEEVPHAGTNSAFEICEIDLVSFNMFDKLGGSPNINGVWSGPSSLSDDYLGVFNPAVNVEGVYTYSVSSDIANDQATLTIKINKTSAPTVTSNTQTFCEVEQAKIGDLVAIGDQIQWYSDTSNTKALDLGDPLIDGASYFATQTNPTTNCESAVRTEVKVHINKTSAPTVSNSTQTFCDIEHATVGDLTAVGNNLKWYADETSTTVLDLSELILDGEDYFASQTNETTNCESVNRVRVSTVIIKGPEAPIINNKEQLFCENNFVVISDLDVEGNYVKWYADKTSTIELGRNELLVNNTSYFASQINNLTGCESLDRTEVTVQLLSVDIPVLKPGGDAFCSIDNPTLFLLNNNVSVENGASIVWYDSPTGETRLDLDDLLIHDQSYYAVAVGVNGCESVEALEVVVDLEACDEKKISFFDGFSPNNDGVNDTFKVLNIEYLYPDYEIEYFNRWGSSVYKADVTKPSWNGRLHGDGELMPVGVYYYILNFNKNNKKPKQGRLYLSR